MERRSEDGGSPVPIQAPKGDPSAPRACPPQRVRTTSVLRMRCLPFFENEKLTYTLVFLRRGHIADLTRADVRKTDRLRRRTVHVKTARVSDDTSDLNCGRCHSPLDEIEICGN
jgi:hypothetical protein